VKLGQEIAQDSPKTINPRANPSSLNFLMQPTGGIET